VFLLALVVAVTMTALIVILPLVVMMMIRVALPAVAKVTPLTLFRDTADFLVVLLPERMMHLTSHAMLNLTLFIFLQGSHLLLAN
jgi:hypothetical protein